MVSVSLLAIFFLLLVFFYPMICLVLAVSAWSQKRWADKGGLSEEEFAAIIDARTDRRKERAFIVSIALLFFVLAPFLVFLLMGIPFMG